MSHAVSSPLAHDIKIVSQHNSLLHALRAVSQHSCSVSHPCHDTRAPPVMIQNFVSRHTPVARPRACAVARPCAQVGCVVCVAGHVAPGHARLCPAVSRYNLLYRVPAPKLGSSPFQLHCNFFFHSFFFLCSSYCKTTKFIYLIFFSNLSVEPQKPI